MLLTLNEFQLFVSHHIHSLSIAERSLRLRFASTLSSFCRMSAWSFDLKGDVVWKVQISKPIIMRSCDNCFENTKKTTATKRQRKGSKICTIRETYSDQIRLTKRVGKLTKFHHQAPTANVGLMAAN